MRIAMMTDAHGNLPALKAALAEIRRHGVDLIVHTGDAIAIGPFPAECLECFLELDNAELIMGNHEEYFAFGLPALNSMSDGEVAHQAWVHEQLDPGLRAVMREWPYEVTHTDGNLAVTFVHYAMDQSRTFLPIMKTPAVDEMERAFARYAGSLVCYGHNHRASDIKGERRYVNPGSLGCAPTAVARFCIIEAHAGGWSVSHHAVPHDDRPLYEAFEERKVPDREFIYKAFFGSRFRK